MKTIIITSKQDLAGINIKQRLLELFNFKETNESFENNKVYQYKDIKLYTTEKNSTDCNNIDEQIDCDQIIFATKHRSEKGTNSLSCHAPGNWSEAKVGGFDGKLSIAPAILLKNAFIKLNELGKNTNYEITLECTHHGPLTNKPAMFIEIGSNEEQWQNKDSAVIIAKTIIETLEMKNNNYKIAFGIGGMHYCPSFNKKILETDIAIGHICPKYQLQYLDKEMIKQAINKTKEKVDFILLDWKGLGKEKQNIINLLKEMNLKYKRSDQLD